MKKDEFLIIAEKIYKSSKEFWEGEFPEEFDMELKLAGKDSYLSSLELVTFLAELETELLNFKINISFLDKILEEEVEDVTCAILYKLINEK